jgi:hypothetical protein
MQSCDLTLYDFSVWGIMANVNYQKPKDTKNPWAITEAELKVCEDKVFKHVFHCNEKDLTLSLKITVEI